MEKHPLVKEILFTREEIIIRTIELAKIINEKYQHNQKPVILLGILKGCILFLAELMNHLTITCELEFITVASFHGETKAITMPEITMDITRNVKNQDILIVEDIIESGRSLKLLKETLLLKGATSVKVVTLLDKIEGRKTDFNADWSGFKTPNEFLVGYGLDYKEQLRNLPYVGVLELKNKAN